MNLRVNMWWVVVPLVAAIAGCSDLGSPLKLLPRIELSASALDFGTVVVGGSVTRQVTIGNSGNADLHGFATLSCPGYGLDAGGGAFTVPPASQHSVIVRYQPGTVGSSPCVLALGDGLPSVTLAGAGALQAPGSACEVSASTLDFGTLAVGGNKLAVFKIRSTGSAPVILNVVSSCGAFSVLGGGGARTLAPGDSLAVTLLFAPLAGGPSTCTVATGPGCPDVTVTGAATSVSFATQILPIFNSRGCVGCHFFMQQVGGIVNVPAGPYAPAVYVKPFDTAGSVLYGKVANTGQYGPPMPQGSPLIPVSERNLIRTWILEGARNN